MKFRLGLTGSLVVLMTLLMLVSQAGSSLSIGNVLRDTTRIGEMDKVRTLGTLIESLLERETIQTTAFAKSLGANKSLAIAVARAGTDGLQEAADLLARLYSGSHLDFLEVTNDKEIVIFRAHDTARAGDRSAVWGVAEALNGAPGIATSVDARGVALRATEPLVLDGKIVGTVSGGVFIAEKFISGLSRQVGAKLALLARLKPERRLPRVCCKRWTRAP